MEFVGYNSKEGKLRRRTTILHIHLLAPSWNCTEFLKKHVSKVTLVMNRIFGKSGRFRLQYCDSAI